MVRLRDGICYAAFLRFRDDPIKSRSEYRCKLVTEVAVSLEMNIHGIILDVVSERSEALLKTMLVARSDVRRFSPDVRKCAYMDLISNICYVSSFVPSFSVFDFYIQWVFACCADKSRPVV
jgi:hypothetical protein